MIDVCFMKEENKHRELNRSFARRVGKALSPLKQNLINFELTKYLYKPEAIDFDKFNRIFLEVGFGMGEHFLNQIKINPNDFYVGVEVYINGVANALKKLKQLDCNNFMIWPDDIDLILEKIPPHSLDGIYILFPDPWHKRRHLKKRLLNEFRLNSFKEKLKNDGFLIFASDIEDYFDATYRLLKKDSDFIIKNKDFTIAHDGYVQTKYHGKAIKEGRSAQFIQAHYSLPS